MLNRFLDWILPSRICARNGHKVVGWESMGPHLNNPEKGPGGGVFYGLRYVTMCETCKQRDL